MQLDNKEATDSAQQQEELENARVRIQELEDEIACMEDRARSEVIQCMKDKKEVETRLQAAETALTQLQLKSHQTMMDVDVHSSELESARNATSQAEQRCADLQRQLDELMDSKIRTAALIEELNGKLADATRTR